jgi:hypothetical protein
MCDKPASRRRLGAWGVSHRVSYAHAAPGCPIEESTYCKAALAAVCTLCVCVISPDLKQ